MMHFWALDSGCPPPPGERKREGYESPAVIGQVYDGSRALVCSPARGSTYGGRRIVTPRGGPPPPTLFGPRHCNRTDLRGRTLGVCTLKMVSLLSLFSIFGIFGIIDCWRDSWRAYLEETFPKYIKVSTKSSLGGSKIKPWSLQNGAWSPPRHYFKKTLNLRQPKNASRISIFAFLSQLGSILEGVLEVHFRGNMPKSLQKYQKIISRPSKIEPWSLQNGAWSPPRRNL